MCSKINPKEIWNFPLSELFWAIIELQTVRSIFKGETDIICTNLKKQENERAPSDWLIFRSSDWLLQCHKMTLTCRERESINKLGITVNRRVYLVILIIMIHIYDS